MVVFFLFVSAKKQDGWVFEASLFPQGTLFRQLNHPRDCKANHSTSSDARHVIFRIVMS